MPFPKKISGWTSNRWNSERFKHKYFTIKIGANGKGGKNLTEVNEWEGILLGGGKQGRGSVLSLKRKEIFLFVGFVSFHFFLLDIAKSDYFLSVEPWNCDSKKVVATVGLIKVEEETLMNNEFKYQWRISFYAPINILWVQRLMNIILHPKLVIY